MRLHVGFFRFYIYLYMRVKFEIACEDFSFSYLPLYINKKYFLIGPVSRAARWQLKALRPPGLQVESYLNAARWQLKIKS